MLVILHCNTFVPRPKFVTVVFGVFGDVIVPEPDVMLHVPVPLVGVFAASVVVGFKIHNVWLDPALAMLGAGSTCITIVENVCGQAPPFEIVHLSTFIPNPTFVTVVVGLFGLVITALPIITAHVPTPLVGVLPARVVLGFKIQSV